MEINELFAKKAFQNLDAAQLSAFKDIYQKLQGKSAVEAMPMILSFLSNMPKGQRIPPNETKEMLNALLENMEPSEKAKYQNVLHMIESMKQ